MHKFANSSRRAVLLLALSAAGSLALADSYVLRNVRIVTPGKAPISNGMIIVSGDKIVHVGAPTSYEVGFTEIDCAGMTAYPGFIDAYTRSGLDLPSAPSNADPPSAVDGPLASMWHENRKGVYADLDVSQHVDPKSLEERHKQGVTLAMQASGRGAFGGLTSLTAMIGGEKPTIVASRLFQEMSFNTSGGGYPGSAMARIAFLRQLLIDGEHLLANPPQDGEPDAVVTAIGDVAAGLQRTLFNADSEREIQRALNLADEFGIRMTIFGTASAWEHAEALKSRNIAVIAQAAFPREPRKDLNEDPVRRLNDPPIEYLTEQYEKWQDECLAVLKLHRAGVKFALSSDGDTNIFLSNLRKHIELGLPAEAALRAVTSDAAEILGVGDKYGTLEVGKMANIVLMTGELASAETKIKHVFVHGKKFDIKEDN